MAHFAGVHLEGMHLMAGHATAGAATVQSMARPVSAAVMPGGMAAQRRWPAQSSAKPWSPQTAANTQAAERRCTDCRRGRTAAPSNPGAEAAASGSHSVGERERPLV